MEVLNMTLEHSSVYY